MAFHPVLASFVGNNTWFGVLLGIHIGGAIIGLGPTYGFGLMGAMAKAGGPAALTIMEVIEKIEKAIVVPELILIQLSTGILLIFNRGLNHGFFGSQRAWLVAGIGVYVVAMTISLGVDGPARRKTIAMAKSGEAGTPAFNKLVGIQQKMGPLLGLLATIIVVLMIWKPGSGCSPPVNC